jgi:hypothetical protein
MVDFKINLAKTMVSTPEQRQAFYHRMLIYLVICSAGLVYIAYFSAVNIVKAIHANRERQMLIGVDTAVTEAGKNFYSNPDQTYQELDAYAKDLETLRALVSKRAHFLPVLNQLFVDFPDNIALQYLTAKASTKTIEFGLVAPLFDPKGGSPVSKLQAQWKGNKELLNRTTGVRQVTSERRVVGDAPAVFVKFECVLK